MQEMKSQNKNGVNTNDDATLTDHDNRKTNDEINSFPETISHI